MFQMKDVGGRIATKRKALNMTQMELADLMGVSFQAVSNWERGNSMPDISKLPELAQHLNMTIDELLNDEMPAKLVRHIIDGDAIDYIHEEKIPAHVVADVAPILKPQQTESMADVIFAQHADGADLDDLTAIAPFVSDSFLHSWALKVASVEDIKQLTSLAPFLRSETLDVLVDKLGQENVPVRSLISLAPFLSDETLNRLARQSVDNVKIPDLISLAPFLSKDTLDALVNKLSEDEDLPLKKIVGLAPFLSKEALDKLAGRMVKSGNPNDLAAFAPFLSKEVLQACADELATKHGIKGIMGLLPFL